MNDFHGNVTLQEIIRTNFGYLSNINITINIRGSNNYEIYIKIFGRHNQNLSAALAAIYKQIISGINAANKRLNQILLHDTAFILSLSADVARNIIREIEIARNFTVAAITTANTQLSVDINGMLKEGQRVIGNIGEGIRQVIQIGSKLLDGLFGGVNGAINGGINGAINGGFNSGKVNGSIGNGFGTGSFEAAGGNVGATSEQNGNAEGNGSNSGLLSGSGNGGIHLGTNGIGGEVSGGANGGILGGTKFGGRYNLSGSFHPGLQIFYG